MRRRYALSFMLVSLALTACGTAVRSDQASTPATGTAAPPAITPSPVVGAAHCAGGSGVAMAAAQAAAQFVVYCPAWLPDGMRYVELPPDPKEQPVAYGTTASFEDAAGRQILLYQGLGNSVFIMRLPGGGIEQPAGPAAFGDLAGKLYTRVEPTVQAFDGDVGHMINGSGGVSADEVMHVAQSMTPVSPEAAMLIHAGATNGMIFEPMAPGVIDPAGQDVRNPFVCGTQPRAGERASVVVRGFAAPPGGADEGHRPSIVETLVRFSDPAAAAAYVNDVRALADTCPATRPGRNSTLSFDRIDVGVVAAQAGADDAIAFNEIERSDVQGLQSDVLYARVGAHVVIVTREQTMPRDAPMYAVTDVVSLLSRAVDAVSRAVAPVESATAVAGDATCVAGSAAAIERARAGVGLLYCPTWLPDGLALTPDISGDVTFAGDAGRKVTLLQIRSASLFIVLGRDGLMTSPDGPARFGEIDGSFYTSARTLGASNVVVAHGPDGNDGAGHMVRTYGLSLDDTLRIARSMIPVPAESKDR